MSETGFAEKVMKSGNGDIVQILNVMGIQDVNASFRIMDACDEIRKLEISIGYFKDSDMDLQDDLSHEIIILQALRCRREGLKRKLMKCVLEGGEE